MMDRASLVSTVGREGRREGERDEGKERDGDGEGASSDWGINIATWIRVRWAGGTRGTLGHGAAEGEKAGG